jgi:purine-cytosine permease-like protein
MFTVFALSAAAEQTIVSIAIWGVFFPALVTGLIGLALAGVARERTENEELRNRRRRG